MKYWQGYLATLALTFPASLLVWINAKTLWGGFFLGLILYIAFYVGTKTRTHDLSE